eukprot:4129502-Amphidinium_carterae.1
MKHATLTEATKCAQFCEFGDVYIALVWGASGGRGSTPSGKVPGARTAQQRSNSRGDSPHQKPIGIH